MQKKVFFPNLDGLRFIAFFLVFIDHAYEPKYAFAQTTQPYQLLHGLSFLSSFGVSFFFVLSGFLITYLLLTEEGLNEKIDVPAFYARRFLRIWPLYYACVAFGFLVFPLAKSFFGQPPHEPASPLLFLTFLGNFDIAYHNYPESSVLRVLWSVAIEEQFYLFWPLLLVLFRLRREWLFVLIILSSLFFRYQHTHVFKLMYFHTFSVMSDMAVGGLSAWLVYQQDGFRRFFENRKRYEIILAYVTGVLAIAFRHHLFITPELIALERLVFSVFFAFVILEQNFSAHSFYKTGSNSFLTYWGKYTYGLYCLHFIAIDAVQIISAKIGTNTTLLNVLFWEPVLAFGVSLGISWVSFHFFEKYFLLLKNRFAYVVR